MFRFIFSKKFLVQLLVALILLAVGIGGVYYYMLSYTRSGEAIEVPELTGLDIIETESMLGQLNLQYEIIDSLYLPGKRGGEIVDQEPIPTSLVKPQRKIYLTITRYSSPMVKLPNVLDQTPPLAMAKLSSYRFEIGDLIYRPSDCKECVIGIEVRGKKVQPGVKLPQGEKIDIVVGQGLTDEMIAVPTLYGLTSEEAKRLLNLSSLNLGATPYDEVSGETKEDSASAVVYRQYPEPGAARMIPLGSSVDIHLTSVTEKVPPVNIDSLKALIK